MVLCAEDNVLFSSRYNQMNSMNSYGYSPQPQDQYSSQMGNQDGYPQYQVSYSDPNIQQMAHSASWAGIYAARSGHGSAPQGTITHGQGALLEEWQSPTPQQYCTSSNSDSSPSPNGYSYSMAYRSAMSPSAHGMDYGIPSPGHSPTPTVHGTGVSVIASHQSNPCPVGERSACQGSPTGSRPMRPPYDWMKRQTYQTVPSAGKTRTKDKYRVVYSDHQRLELEKEFHYSRYITIRRKAELAQSLGLSERQVKIWFQNRRAKERKQKKKEDAMGGVKVIAEVPLQGQSLAHAQQAQMHPQTQSTHPAPELNQSQTPHLSHTRVQTQEMLRQEEVPNSSALEVLQQ